MIDQLQKTFNDSFVKELIDGIKSGRTIEQYATQSFEIDDSKVKYISGLYTPIGLQDRMIAALKRDKRHGVEAAIELYKAYKDLNPLVASDESFWAYLCHTELKEFVQLEWPFEKAKNPSNYILDHYFFRMGYDRNALASLWWGVYLSYDNEREERGEDPYTLTRVFFKNYSLRVVWLTIILRIKNALLGVLEFLNTHPDITASNVDNRGLFISKYFNMLGATKQLSSLPKQFFMDEMNRLYPIIMSIHNREDVTRKEAAAIINSVGEDEMPEIEE